MTAVETVMIKADNERGYKIINASEFDAEKHELADGQVKPLSGKAAEIAEQEDARRQYEANRGQTGGSAVDTSKNPSGTFSEPTPTDIRYPNKDETEFENNHGAFVGKSAAGLRAELGMEQKPGGLNPAKKKAEDQKEADARMEAKRLRDGEIGEQRGRGRPPAEPTENLDDMTVAQLRDYAAEHEIDLTGLTRKEDIRAAIDEAGAGNQQAA